MKAPFARDTETTTRAAAHQSSQNSIAVPAVPFQQEQSAEDPLHEEASSEADMQQPLEIDMDEDGVDEPHILFIHPEDGTLWLHSDEQTLSLFIKRKRKKNPSAQVLKLLKAIEDTAVIVHTGKYGIKTTSSSGKAKRKVPTALERGQAQLALQNIAGLMAQLNQLTNVVMKKHRPPSHQSLLTKKIIGQDTFCQKVVMAPLSILRRDDSLEGSPPQEKTSLWKRLTKIAGYKRGHMLNEHLHGPGINTNLVPISTAFNSTMKTGVEKATKEAVNANNKVVRFEAEALNWGTFKGAFGFPDEQSLPAKFHFKVTQMELISGNGNDGSDIKHWQDTGKVIFDDSPDHDIPVDVVKGIVGPVVKNFVPGYYFHPGGKIKPAPNSTTSYHLMGNFSINGMNYLLPALGLDDPGQLPSSFISEKVLTEYQVPPGYHMVYPFPSTPVDCIYRGQIENSYSSTPAFLIVNSAKNATLKNDFEEEKKKIIKREEQKKQQQLDAQAIEQQQREEKIEQARIWKEENARKKEENARKREEMQRNDDYRHDLLARIRQEGRKYETKFHGPSLTRYRKEREEMLYIANNKWKADEHLFNNDADSLLDPLRAELVKIKDLVLEWQSIQEKKEEQENLLKAEQERQLQDKRMQIIEGLFLHLNETIEQEFLPALEGSALSYFQRKVAEIFATYRNFWENKVEVLKAAPEKLLDSPKRKLRTAFEEAKVLPVEKEQPVTNRDTSPGPFNRFKRKLGREDYEETEKEVEKTRLEPFRHKPPGEALRTTQPNTPPLGPFTLPTKRDVNTNNSGPSSSGDGHQLVTVARRIWNEATILHNQSRNNNFLQQQLFQLNSPMQQFTVTPTKEGWYIISGILSQLEKLDALHSYALKWTFMWNSIRP